MHLPCKLLHELPLRAAQTDAAAPALRAAAGELNYGALAAEASSVAAGLGALGLRRGDRLGVWLEKRHETVLACLGACAAGGVFVPINPLLKPEQVSHIAHDCQLSVLVTSAQRWALLQSSPADLPAPGAWSALRHVVLVDHPAATGKAAQADGPTADPTAARKAPHVHPWPALPASAQGAFLASGVVESDPCAIFYTSGSTGRPKGVVLSHRNLLAGAESVAGYLGNGPQDTLLAALPLSFDAGFSQLTTAFASGARVVLHNYLLPGDLLRALDEHQVTGLTAVPPLFMQLLQAQPASAGRSLRYFATTGGRMPRATLQALRQRWPQARPFLMYGLTEAFRSTYLAPEEVDRRPDSIGKAIPNAEILVLREDGSECDVDEPGELVHRGPLVAQGYWGDPDKTAERFRPLPAGLRLPGLVLPEMAVYSGDTARRDAEGFLYFIGRRDEMIKTSGYRVSPAEVEEVLHATGLVAECAAFGVDHAVLGQAIHAVVTVPDGAQGVDVAALLAACRQQVPAYMVPVRIEVALTPLPRNPNGKIDRKLLASSSKGVA